MKHKISILGCGWLGLPLAQSLTDKLYNVKGSTTTQNKIALLQENKISAFLIKLENFDADLSLFLDSEILIVPVPSKNIAAFMALIAKIELSPIKKVIFISSTSVYINSQNPILENSALHNSPLVEIENLFLENKNFKTTIIRFAGLFGYNRQPANFFAETRAIPNPEGPVNMIHRDDCISVIEKIIEAEAWGQIFNACADLHPSRREFYTNYAIASDKKVPNFDELSPFEKKLICNEKLKKTLNFEFSRKLLPPIID